MRNRYFIHVLWSVSLCLGLFQPGVLANSKVHWAQEKIDLWKSQNLLRDDIWRDVRPNTAITRAEFVQLINSTMLLADPKTAPATSFTDVRASDWFASDINAAVANGYVRGYADNTVRPNDPVTRRDAMVLLARMKKLPDAPTVADSFADIQAIPLWSRGAIGAAVQAKWTEGYPDKKFRPNEHITRAQAIVVLERIRSTMPLVVATQGTYEGKNMYGNVVIAASGVTLRNTRIFGTLTIDASIADGEVTLNEVSVDRELLVRAKGLASLTMTGGTVNTVRVDRSEAKPLRIQSGTQKPPALDISGANQSVLLEGKFGRITLAGASNTATLGKNATADTLSIEPSATQATAVVEQQAQVKSIEANAKALVRNAGEIGDVRIQTTGAHTSITNDTTGVITSISTNGTIAINNQGTIRNNITGTGASAVALTGKPIGTIVPVPPVLERTITDEILDGLTMPVVGATPQSAISNHPNNAQYDMAIQWFRIINGVRQRTNDPFVPNAVYVAEVSLTAKTGFNPLGLAKDFFQVPGITKNATNIKNEPNSGVVTVTFPVTTAVDVPNTALSFTHATPLPGMTITDFGIASNTVIERKAGTTTTWNILQGTTSVDIPSTVTTFQDNTQYVLTMTVRAKPGYTFPQSLTQFNPPNGTTSVRTLWSGDRTEARIVVTFAESKSQPTGQSIELTAQPVSGASVSSVALSNMVLYELKPNTPIQWKSIDNGKEIAVPTNASFATNVSYVMTCTIRPKVGYAFPQTLTNFAIPSVPGASVTTTWNATRTEATVVVAFPKTTIALQSDIVAFAGVKPATGVAVSTMDLTADALIQRKPNTPIQWSTVKGENETPTTEGTFANATVYRATLTVVPKEGYRFPSTWKQLRVSGATTTTTFNESFTEAVLVVTFPMTAIDLGTDAVRFGSAKPQTGAQIDAFDLDPTRNVERTTAPIVWMNQQNGVWQPILATTKTFAANTMYRMQLTIKPKLGYAFAGNVASFVIPDATVTDVWWNADRSEASMTVTFAQTN